MHIPITEALYNDIDISTQYFALIDMDQYLMYPTWDVACQNSYHSFVQWTYIGYGIMPLLIKRQYIFSLILLILETRGGAIILAKNFDSLSPDYIHLPLEKYIKPP